MVFEETSSSYRFSHSWPDAERKGEPDPGTIACGAVDLASRSSSYRYSLALPTSRARDGAGPRPRRCSSRSTCTARRPDHGGATTGSPWSDRFLVVTLVYGADGEDRMVRTFKDGVWSTAAAAPAAARSVTSGSSASAGCSSRRRIPLALSAWYARHLGVVPGTGGEPPRVVAVRGSPDRRGGPCGRRSPTDTTLLRAEPGA